MHGTRDRFAKRKPAGQFDVAAKPITASEALLPARHLMKCSPPPVALLTEESPTEGSPETIHGPRLPPRL